MAYAHNSVFFGEINGKNAVELMQTIDYTKTKLEDRMEVVEEIIGTGFHAGYIEDHFKVNLNASDALSEQDAICAQLEKMANYLLNSEEVKEEKKESAYVFYSDEEAFRKAVNKEPKIDSMGAEENTENVIHFLKKENRNFKKSKDQSIKTKDLQREDFLGEVLRDYKQYLNAVTVELKKSDESKLSRFKLSEISGAVRQDMIQSKDMILGVFGYKTNAEESTVYDWDLIDLTNIEHIKALLYQKPGYRADEDLRFVIDEFVEILHEAKPTPLQQEIVEVMRSNKGPTEVGEVLGISKQQVTENIKRMANKILKVVQKRGY